MKKLSGFNNLNDRILRTRNVNRTFIRTAEQENIKKDNKQMAGKIDIVRARKTKYPPVNYQLPTGIYKFNYQGSRSKKDLDTSSQRSVRSNASRKSYESQRSNVSKKSNVSNTSNVSRKSNATVKSCVNSQKLLGNS